MSQKYCSSCGLPIPDGQGKSCSMCYGDIDYGHDGYAREEWERSQREYEARQAPYEQTELAE